MRVAIFSGGRGSLNLQRSFLSISGLELSFLINGYDSGLSTGFLRKEIPGFLGPSDFRKTISSILQIMNPEEHTGLLLEERIPLKILSDFARTDLMLSPILKKFPNIAVGTAMSLTSLVRHTLLYLSHSESARRYSEPISLGNLMIAGLFLDSRDFNNSISEFCKILNMSDQIRILNVTKGENLYLGAILESGEVVNHEEIIVGKRPKSPIRDIFLTRDLICQSPHENCDYQVVNEETVSDILLQSVKPAIDPQASLALKHADAIVFSTGTRHSSLFPSYLTREIKNLIQNSQALKIYLANSHPDLDIYGAETEISLVRKHLKLLGDDSIDEIWVSSNADSTYCPKEKIWQSNQEVAVKLWNNKRIGFSSNTFLESNSLHMLLKKSILPLDSSDYYQKNLLSIIVPSKERAEILFDSLNVLQSQTSNLGLAIEIVVVESKPSGLSKEFIEAFPKLVFVVSSGESRYEAIRHGLETSRGEFILIWCADNEYSQTDLKAFITPTIKNSSIVSIASRAHFAPGTGYLKEVYRGKKVLYWISRIGGNLLCAVMGIRFGRFISDPFSGICLMHRNTAVRHLPQKGGAEGFSRMIITLIKKEVQIIEISVPYSPRALSREKKTKVRSGLLALLYGLGIIK
jgi:2-phospho-L-lactate transferase CofD/Glycosyl transferase family 2